MFCACEIRQLFPVVLSLVRALHKFDFRFVTNETPNIWRPTFV